MAGGEIDRFADRWLAQPPVYLTDLDRCEPAAALVDVPALRHWRTLAYTTEDLQGTMLLAGPQTAAPTITYPLEASGWHAISVGLVRCHHGGHHVRASELQVRLTGDRVGTVLVLPSLADHQADEPMPEHREVAELFWKHAELDGQQLELGQPAARVKSGDEAASFACGAVHLAYIKLVPLTNDEAALVEADRSRVDTKRLFAHNDSHGPHWIWRLTAADEIRREIEPYRDTDFSRMYWEAGGGDEVHYFSKIAHIPTVEEVHDFSRRGDRLHAESWREFSAAGIDPFAVAVEHTHELGMEFHAAWRVSGFHYPPPIDHNNFGDTFYDRHPEWRGEDREGRRTPIMAYTYEGVRQFAVSLLREMAQYPIDGVCPLFNRRLPLVEYEPPLVEGFMREFGTDPRELDERDPTWLAYRSRVLTQFMREVRQAMDEVSREQGRSKPIAVSAVVEGTEAANAFFGCDLKTWAQEGLVDTLIPYVSDWEARGGTAPWTDARELDYFLDAVDGTACLLAPNLMPRSMSPEDFRRRAATIYGAGVEHLFFWDSAGGHGRANNRPMWSAVRRLGHVDEVLAWRDAGEPDLGWISSDLRSVGGWSTAYADAG